MMSQKSADATSSNGWVFDGAGKSAPENKAPRDWWCSLMAKGSSASASELYVSVTEPVCGRLRTLFGGVAQEEMPDQLADLADRLQDALERGDLFAANPNRSL